MSKRFAILCPGQGAQHVDMFALAKPEFPLDIDPNDLLSQPDNLFRNCYAQPLVVAAGLAQWNSLKGFIPAPSMVAGYSVGEITACVVAGALPAEAAVALAGRRAQLMDRCVAPAEPQVLLAISEIARSAVLTILAKRGMFVAIDNGYDRLVAGGLLHQCSGIEGDIVSAGGSCIRLPVAVASHTPLMSGAITDFDGATTALTWTDPVFPVIGGVGALPLYHAGALRQSLVEQLSHTLAWASCTDAWVEQGVVATLELGPGTALSRMMRARHPAVASRALEEFRSVAAAAEWLNRQLAQ